MSAPKPWEQASLDRAQDRAYDESVRKFIAEPISMPTPKRRINIRQKGANGERELATDLNEIVNALLRKHGIPVPVKPVIQRNQNQTAVGGNDLSNCFGIGIEVKRQEQLSVNKWWEQCVKSCEKNREFPVLIYRQNKQAWRVVMNAWAQLPAGLEQDSVAMMTRAEVTWQFFLHWFHNWVDRKLSNGELPQC